MNELSSISPKFSEDHNKFPEDNNKFSEDHNKFSEDHSFPDDFKGNRVIYIYFKKYISRNIFQEAT